MVLLKHTTIGNDDHLTKHSRELSDEDILVMLPTTQSFVVSLMDCTLKEKKKVKLIIKNKIGLCSLFVEERD